MSFGTISDWKLQAWLLANAPDIITFSAQSLNGVADSKVLGSPHAVRRDYAGWQFPESLNKASNAPAAQRGMHYVKKLYRPASSPVGEPLSPEYEAPANVLDTNSAIDFVSKLPDIVRSKLSVQERLYRSFVYEKNGIQYEADLRIESMDLTPAGALKNQGFGVQLESIEINRLGGNPEEIDSNIKVDIRLFATKMHKLFEKQPFLESNLVLPAGHTMDTIAANAPGIHSQLTNPEGCVSWIDLIKFNVGEGGGFADAHQALLETVGIEPLGAFGANLPNARGYGNKNQRIKLLIGYDTSIISTLYHNGKLNGYYRTEINPDTGELFESATQYAAYLVELIEAQTEVYYLNLIQNSINYNSTDGSVTLQINYTASSGTNEIDRKADLLFDPYYYELELRINDDICKLQKNLRENQHNAEKVTLDPFYDLRFAGQTGTMGTSEFIARTKEQKEQAITRLGTVKQKLYQMQVNKLMNGLYGSAMFPANKWPAHLNKLLTGTTTLGKKLAHDILHSRVYYAVVDDSHVKTSTPLPVRPGYWTVQNVGRVNRVGTYRSTNSNAEQYKMTKKLFETNHPNQPPATDSDYEKAIRTLGMNAISGDVDDTRVEFCFFGDIVEVAFEILSSNNRLGQMNRTTLMGVSANKQTLFKKYWDEKSTSELHNVSDVNKKLWEDGVYIDALIQPFYWERTMLKGKHGSDRSRQGRLAGSSFSSLRDSFGLIPNEGANARKKLLTDFLQTFVPYDSNSAWTLLQSREELLYDLFGEVLMTQITYQKPGDLNTEISISLADLPVSMVEFKKWFRNNIAGGRGKRKHLFLKNYLEMLLKFASDLVVKAIRQDNTATADVEPPSLVINRYFTENTAERNRSIPVKFIQRYGSATANSYYNEKGGINSYVSRINMKSIRKPDPTTGIKYHLGLKTNNPSNVKVFTILGQTPNIISGIGSMSKRAGDEEDDRKVGIAHIHFSSPDKGILNDINFEREDMPGLREARLFEGKDLFGMDILREKYNGDLRFVGTTYFKPGMILYIDPDDLDLGRTVDRFSPARALGLGGYHLVVRVNHTIKLGRSRTWETKVETQWQTFGDETDDGKGITQELCETSMSARYAVAYQGGARIAMDIVDSTIMGPGSVGTVTERQRKTATRRLDKLTSKDLRNLHARLSPEEWLEIEDELERMNNSRTSSRQKANREVIEELTEIAKSEL